MLSKGESCMLERSSKRQRPRCRGKRGDWGTSELDGARERSVGASAGRPTLYTRQLPINREYVLPYSWSIINITNPK